ncbi:TetR/AcrR family transcriptional regulator [Alcanivorax marinus]|uniref:TetR/AcrR family transcriptional regulator n=1 Tax=Alloalcanivorax marinus TaxID=1177169 RepID=A0A9Q3YQA9_9GAMM|nr:TetR/AcrR family transcriptional regulator [Alloalcanivorax marinus]MCC4307473.1 TetR/AcrR family transcriptional regulator [Alloalcanivorax marinus]
MARRNEHSKPELRALAIGTVRTLVAEQGLEKLSVREVARRLGYAPAMLYHLFDNLDDLILHVNADTLDTLLDRMDAAAAMENPRAALTAMAHHYLELSRAQTPLWQLVFEHRMNQGAPVPAWYQRRTRSLFLMVEQQLERLAPWATERERLLGARTLWGSLHGICVLYLGDKLDVAGDVDPREMVDSLLRHYLADWSATTDHRPRGDRKGARS